MSSGSGRFRCLAGTRGRATPGRRPGPPAPDPAAGDCPGATASMAASSREARYHVRPDGHGPLRRAGSSRRCQPGIAPRRFHIRRDQRPLPVMVRAQIVGRQHRQIARRREVADHHVAPGFVVHRELAVPQAVRHRRLDLLPAGGPFDGVAGAQVDHAALSRARSPAAAARRRRSRSAGAAWRPAWSAERWSARPERPPPCSPPRPAVGRLAPRPWAGAARRPAWTPESRRNPAAHEWIPPG